MKTISSGQLVRLTGISLRSLQWWAENGIVRPRMVGHHRHFTEEMALRVWLVAVLRSKGLAVQRIRETLSTLGRWSISATEAARGFLLVDVDGEPVVPNDAEGVIRYLSEAHGPMILITPDTEPKGGEPAWKIAKCFTEQTAQTMESRSSEAEGAAA